MQKYSREKRKFNHESNDKAIHFRLYKIRDYETVYKQYLSNGQRLSDSRYLEKKHSSGDYKIQREITARFSLSQGHYLIIPNIDQPNLNGNFLMRIFYEISDLNI